MDNSAINYYVILQKLILSCNSMNIKPQFVFINLHLFFVYKEQIKYPFSLLWVNVNKKIFSLFS